MHNGCCRVAAKGQGAWTENGERKKAAGFKTNSLLCVDDYDYLVWEIW